MIASRPSDSPEETTPAESVVKLQRLDEVRERSQSLWSVEAVHILHVQGTTVNRGLHRSLQLSAEALVGLSPNESISCSNWVPRLRMMPNGCLGSPVLVMLFGLDRGFLMDVGPKRVGDPGLRE